MIGWNLRKFWRPFTLGGFVLIAGCAAPTMPPETHSCATSDPANEAPCPPIRKTPQAPQFYYQKQNPLEKTPENFKKGKELYLTGTEPVACANCHGVHGDGQGSIGKYLQPPPTNFTCAELMDTLPDGQLFWVIKSGSGFFEEQPGHSRETIKRPGRRPRGNAMRGHENYLTDKEIWQLVMYIRTFSR